MASPRVMHARFITGLLLALVPARAQGAPEAALKAAFVYNFAKFTDWPHETGAAGPLKLCVLGDPAVADALDATVKGHPIGGRDVAVSRASPDQLRGCHMLYLAALDNKRLSQVLDDVKGAAVLTVSDLDRFAQNGGIAGLFVEAGKMRFAINVEAAQRAGLRISSRLLGLATIVKDERAAIVSK
jgi:hypothetical protein